MYKMKGISRVMTRKVSDHNNTMLHRVLSVEGATNCHWSDKDQKFWKNFNVNAYKMLKNSITLTFNSTKIFTHKSFSRTYFTCICRIQAVNSDNIDDKSILNSHETTRWLCKVQITNHIFISRFKSVYL